MNALTPIPTTFVPLTPRLRARIEATIAELVAILDAFDGDPDAEGDDGFDEDSGDMREFDLGWTDRIDQDDEDFLGLSPGWTAGDREQDAGDDREPDADGEWSGDEFDPDEGWTNPMAESFVDMGRGAAWPDDTKRRSLIGSLRNNQ